MSVKIPLKIVYLDKILFKGDTRMKEKSFSNADDLLKQLVKNNDHLGKYVAELYSPRDEVDGTHLNQLFGLLRDQGLISCFYANNIAYHVKINPQGFDYAQQIDKIKWKDAKSMFDLLHGQIREDLLKLQELYPAGSVIPRVSEFSESIRLLKTRGYLPMFEQFIDGSWGVEYSYNDINYKALEEDYFATRNAHSVNVNVEGENNFVNFATNNSTVNASQNIGINAKQLSDLIAELKKFTENLTNEQKQLFDDWTETIQTELAKKQPKRNIIDAGMDIIKALSNSVQFAAAFASLAQFIQLSIK